MSGRRRKQVADLIRDEVSEILSYEMKDPRLGMVSITKVEMSPDLRYATIYASVLGEEAEQRETLQALSGASGFIRRLLAPRLHIRHIPSLQFRLDHSMAHADEITRTLNALKNEPEETEQAGNDVEGTTNRDET